MTTTAAHWHYITLTLVPEDLRVDPIVGAEATPDRAAAHQQVQSLLDRLAAEVNPALRQTAEIWRRGARDDWVYYDTVSWTIYPCDRGSCEASTQAVLDDHAATLRQVGLQVSVARVTHLRDR